MTHFRQIFPANLRLLIDEQFSGNVSESCRMLDINRTQMNRYLAGEAFPSAVVLKRFCDGFGVDGRFLHMPLADIRGGDLITRETLRADIEELQAKIKSVIVPEYSWGISELEITFDGVHDLLAQVPEHKSENIVPDDSDVYPQEIHAGQIGQVEELSIFTKKDQEQ